jgi:hypothetical protein
MYKRTDVDKRVIVGYTIKQAEQGEAVDRV